MGIFRKASPRGSTFSDLELVPPLDPKDSERSVATLRKAVERYKDDRFDWYLDQMRRRSRLVNGLPGASALLGVVGILSTTGAVVVRTLNAATVIDWTNGDLLLAGAAVVAYTLMSAGLLYERLIEGSGGYFRAAEAVVAIRDLWSAYQFEDVARSLAPAKQGAEELERWRVPAEAFCKALDKIVAAELTEWQAAYHTAAKLRSDTSEEGLKAALAEIKLSADSAASSAAEAARKAEEAAKAAADANAPATLDLSLGTAKTGGTAVIKIDGKEVARGLDQRSFSITQLRQGEHHVRVEFTPSAAGGTMVPFEKSIRLGSGITEATVAVP
ncbi:MAG TPA: hypothetical protein VE053_15620 [Allosphingosinicella sp.]|nr:hypothetical protein [Allosphingosinicella sp.]